MHKAPRIINFNCPFVFVDGYKIYRRQMYDGRSGFRHMLDAIKLTLKGIHEGRDYSLMSAVSYHHKGGVNAVYKLYPKKISKRVVIGSKTASLLIT